MIITNVELRWARLAPTKLEKTFDGTANQWSATLVTRDKEESKKWKEAGLNVKVADDDDGIFYHVKVVKPELKKDGTPNLPIPVVGRDLMPLSPEKVEVIGNGTTANVKLYTFEYDFQGRKGKSFRLDAIQIVELVEYESAGGSLGFVNLDSGTAPTPVNNDDEDVY